MLNNRCMRLDSKNNKSYKANASVAASRFYRYSKPKLKKLENL